MRFSPVTLEFKRGKCAHPLVDQQFSYVRLAAPLLGAASISTEFFAAICTQFCFTYSPGDASVLCLVGYTLDFAMRF